MVINKVLTFNAKFCIRIYSELYESRSETKENNIVLSETFSYKQNYFYGLFIGNEIIAVVPVPGVESSVIVPPKSSIILRVIGNPNPDPPSRVV